MDASSEIARDIKSKRNQSKDADQTAYIVFDTETIPDGSLVARVKYPDDELTPEEAIERAQTEARTKSPTGSDFLPVTFQKPVAICTLRLDADYMPINLSFLDSPKYRSDEMVKLFWAGMEKFHRAKLVTFNGRGFDLPMLEMAAFELGIAAPGYFNSDKRNRYRSINIDLQEFLGNQGTVRVEGGLNLFARRLGLPGKMGTTGHDVYPMYKAGKLQQINDYCACDTIDTYFVFLRTRVMIGELTLEEEKTIFEEAVQWLRDKASEFPALDKYLANILRKV